MQNSSYRNSAKTALGGIVAALSVTLMFLTSVIPTLTYALPAAAGILLVLMVVDVDKKWAFGVYATVSILSLLVLPDKEAAVMYVFFFGHYPILKAILEGRLHGVLLWVLKCCECKGLGVHVYCVIGFVFPRPREEMEDDGKLGVLGLLGLGKVVFVIDDVALSRLVTLCMLKWRKAFRKIMRF